VSNCLFDGSIISARRRGIGDDSQDTDTLPLSLLHSFPLISREIYDSVTTFVIQRRLRWPTVLWNRYFFCQDRITSPKSLDALGFLARSGVVMSKVPIGKRDVTFTSVAVFKFSVFSHTDADADRYWSISCNDWLVLDSFVWIAMGGSLVLSYGVFRFVQPSHSTPIDNHPYGCFYAAALIVSLK
jgi:hypothetical protein